MDLFRIKCHNKSRQRRNLANLVQEWENLQLDVCPLISLIQVEKLDVELLELIPQKLNTQSHAYPLSSWTYHIKLTLVETILFMGFELELYQTHEYVLIYRFASKECLHSYLEYSFLVHNEQLQRVRQHVHVKKRKTKEILYVDFLIMRNAAMEYMCKAYTSV